MKPSGSLAPRFIALALLAAAVYAVLDLSLFHGPLRRIFPGDNPSTENSTAAEKSIPAVAHVNGAAITKPMIDREVETRLWRSGRTADTLSQPDLRVAQFLALEELVLREAAAQAARNSSVKPPAQDEINREYRRAMGVFPSTKSFQDALRDLGFTDESFRDSLSRALRLEAWMESKIAPTLSVSPEEISDWFQENKASLRIPKRYHASHIFLTRHDVEKPDRQPEINSLRDKLRAESANFAGLAREFSEDERTRFSGGDLGWFLGTEAPPEISAALDQLQPGEISPPVLTDLGWHVLRLEEIKPAREATLQESADRIARMLRNHKRIQAVAALRAELKRRATIVYSPEWNPEKLAEEWRTRPVDSANAAPTGQ